MHITPTQVEQTEEEVVSCVLHATKGLEKVRLNLDRTRVQLQPIQYVRIETDRQLLFRRRPRRRCLFEESLVERRNVRIVNVAVLHPVNPMLSRFS